MKCPICGSDVRINTCPKCGLDYDTLSKAGVISDFLFNKGLAAAKRDNMTTAITYLTKSVEFDKMNKNALNLLGLCYYNTGKINEALKVWVLSFHYYGTNSAAARYLKAVEEDSQQLERMRNAANLYNKALSFAQQNNEDLAIVRLKTAVEDNPNFVDALNLLALCHMRTKQNKEALDCIERALAVDDGNIVALSYYKELSQTSAGRKAATRDVYLTPPSQRQRKKSDEVNKRTLPERFKIAELVSFFIGVALAAAFMYFVAFPGLTEHQYNTFTNERDELGQQLDAAGTRLANMYDDIAVLELNNEQLLLELDEMQQNMLELENELAILEGQLQAQQGENAPENGVE